MNDILDSLHFRYSCKKFDPDRKIDSSAFAIILETARLSPSSMGLEPWHFLVVQDRELREKLTEHSYSGRRQALVASHFVIALHRRGPEVRYDSDYVDYIMKTVQHADEASRTRKRARLEEFQRGDFKIADRPLALQSWARMQTYIALGNMMTVAALMGIDSSPIEGFDKEQTDALLATELGIDTDKLGVAYILAFGYRGEEGALKQRRPIEEVVSWYE
jgi:nitroreductase